MKATSERPSKNGHPRNLSGSPDMFIPQGGICQFVSFFGPENAYLDKSWLND